MTRVLITGSPGCTARPRRHPSTIATWPPPPRTLSEDGHAGRNYVLTGPVSLSQVGGDGV